MRIRTVALSVLLVIVIPQLLFSLLYGINQSAPIRTVEEVAIENAEEKERCIMIKYEDHVEMVGFEDYISGVLLAEMPLDFEVEALKAQAVAIRTYTLRNLGRKHTDADICTDASCCQAYINVGDYAGNVNNLQKLDKAVLDTTDYVLTYHGNLIEATYFSCSGGKTEDAVAVWGTSVPYLMSVDSPGEENCKHYEKSITLSKSEFLKKMGLRHDLNLDTAAIYTTYTNGGGVATITIANDVFTGTQVRGLLNLSSTSFHFQVVDDTVIVTTRGNGHRVGMSQYGAEAMAVSGNTFEEILMHYYPGTQLATLSSAQLNAIFDKEAFL